MRWSTGRGITYLVGVAVAMFILIPIYLITLMAFGTDDFISRFPKELIHSAETFTTETVTFFWNFRGVQDSILASLSVAGITIVLSLLLGAPAGYALARYTFAGADAYRLGILATRAFPVVILAVPLVTTYITWGIDDTAMGIALLHTAMALPTTILVTASVFVGVSTDLEAAALTLGCTRREAFRRISLPLALPGLAASTIFTFVLSWNEVFGAAVLSSRNPTLPAKLVSQLGESSLRFRFAGGFFILVPALVFMLFVRRYLMSLWGVKLK